MNAALARAFQALPPELQVLIARHPFDRERDQEELVQNCWVVLLRARAGTPLVATFKRARHATRSYTRDPAYYGRALDENTAAGAGQQYQHPPLRGTATAIIAEKAGCSRRAAQRRLKKAIAGQGGSQGDLFAGALV